MPGIFGSMIQQESSGNPDAYNKKSKAAGLMQITPIVVKEYNNFKKTKLTPEDMLDSGKNLEVGTWYFNERIPQMLKYYKLPDTLDNRLRAYNAGIGTLIKGRYPSETRNYVTQIKGRLK